jgi:hypothetical protein
MLSFEYLRVRLQKNAEWIPLLEKKTERFDIQNIHQNFAFDQKKYIIYYYWTGVTC